MRPDVTLKRHIVPLRPAEQMYCRGFCVILALFLLYHILRKEIPPEENILEKKTDTVGPKESSGIVPDVPSNQDTLKWLSDISSGSELIIDEAIVASRDQLLQTVQHQMEDNKAESLPQLLRQRQVFKVPDLDCVRHRKFTSDRLRTPGVFSFFKSMLVGQDPYEDIDLIFHTDNHVLWRSAGTRLTVYSNNPFSPYYIRIKMPSDQRVSIFGLRVEEDKLATMKTFMSYYLGTFDMGKFEADSTGSMYIACRARNCNSHFTFLMFLFERTEVLELEVFGTQFQQPGYTS